MPQSAGKRRKEKKLKKRLKTMAETVNEESTPTTLLHMTEQVRQKHHGTPSDQSSGQGSSVSEAPISDSLTPGTPETPEVFETSSNTEFYVYLNKYFKK